MRGLAGKVAIVTGGAGRIGRGGVRRLVEEGSTVMIADLDLAAAQDAARCPSAVAPVPAPAVIVGVSGFPTGRSRAMGRLRPETPHG